MPLIPRTLPKILSGNTTRPISLQLQPRHPRNHNFDQKKKKRSTTKMKKFFIIPAICSLFTLAAIAQTPTPPARTTTAPSSAPAGSAPSAGGTGAEGKIAYLNVALFGQGISELKVKLEALYSEFEPKNKEIKAEEEELNNLKSKISN